MTLYSELYKKCTLIILQYSNTIMVIAIATVTMTNRKTYHQLGKLCHESLGKQVPNTVCNKQQYTTISPSQLSTGNTLRVYYCNSTLLILTWGTDHRLCQIHPPSLPLSETLGDRQTLQRELSTVLPLDTTTACLTNVNMMMPLTQ